MAADRGARLVRADRLARQHVGPAGPDAGGGGGVAGAVGPAAPGPLTPLPDLQLTEDGLAPSGRGRVLLLACGALAHEIIALRRANGWNHLDLQCLPAIWHNHPDRIVPAITQAVATHRAAYDRIFVVYADCGTGGQLQTACDALGVGMIPGPHCYSFFTGNDAFAQADDMTAFYLTDFLTRQFDAFVTRPMKLDRHPELIGMLFGRYERVVYLAQTDAPDLDRRGRQIAAKLGLGYERRFVGYGDLSDAIIAAAEPPPRRLSWCVFSLFYIFVFFFSFF